MSSSFLYPSRHVRRRAPTRVRPPPHPRPAPPVGAPRQRQAPARPPARRRAHPRPGGERPGPARGRGRGSRRRPLAAMPEDEARQNLVALARFLLTDAIVEGDLRAVIFVLREEERGRDPARTLADGVLAAHRRAAEPVATPVPVPPPVAMPQPTAAAPRRPRPAADPADRFAWRAATHFRREIRHEFAIMHGAAPVEPSSPATPVVAAALPAAVPAPSPSTPTRPGRPPRNRHERRRSAALRRRAVDAGAPSRPHPRGGTAASPPALACSPRAAGPPPPGPAPPRP